jgi:hypothetical protein
MVRFEPMGCEPKGTKRVGLGAASEACHFLQGESPCLDN